MGAWPNGDTSIDFYDSSNNKRTIVFNVNAKTLSIMLNGTTLKTWS